MDAYEWLPFRLALETGLRIDDVLSVRVSDISVRDGAHVLSYTAHKTGKSGEAAISSELAAALTAGKKKRSAFLFPSNSKSGHITRQCAWQRIKRAAGRCGLDLAGISPHSLRKCFAVDKLHKEGLAAVREALQHSSDAVTALYAYSDTVASHAPDEPIRWRDLELVMQYIFSRITQKKHDDP